MSSIILDKCFDCQYAEFMSSPYFNDRGEVQNLYMRCAIYPRCIEVDDYEEEDVEKDVEEEEEEENND